MRTIVVGSRQSALALTQTGQVIDELNALCTKHDIAMQFTVKKIVTQGDRILDVTLSKVGGKGLFVKEIEQAMLEQDVDMAVHSMKDMPAVLPEGLVHGAVPYREDPRDCLISLRYMSLRKLPTGAKVGTSSLRRASQLKALRPDLQLESIRGNIDSRLRKLETEGFDGIILAAAGLHRMGWKDRITSYLSEDECLPAVGQGALGIECRADDTELLSLLARYNHESTAVMVTAERVFLAELNGGCQVPIGAYAIRSGKKLTLTGMVGSPDGERILKETLTGEHPEQLGKAVAARLKDQGAEEILVQVRG